ncbi:MAG TPA: DUF1343 domain-containing protein, partial [Candidatus Angelobacter sp.]
KAPRTDMTQRTAFLFLSLVVVLWPSHVWAQSGNTELKGKPPTIAAGKEVTTATGKALNRHVLTGIDVLEQGSFAQLKEGKERITIGLLTNQTGLDAQGKRTIDILAAVPGIKLAAIFSPEHGIFGALDTTKIDNSIDAVTGVQVYSLYGSTDAKRRPPVEVLKTLDVLVVDIQDAGVRFYTYETTLGYMLEAAAESNIEVVVLDRPNPITGSLIQGPVSASDFKRTFTNYYPLPVRHGMTLGELAEFFNVERKIGAHLRVISMEGWRRDDWFDSTGINWINPSPNLRSVNEAALYPGVALIEGTNISVGRGTDTPFEVIGAPWIDSGVLTRFLNARRIPGLRFTPATFTPVSGPYANRSCGGVSILVTERNLLDSPEAGLELASALRTLYPRDWKMDNMVYSLANRQVFNQLKAGEDPRKIAESWREDVEKFSALRAKYLLYK